MAYGVVLPGSELTTNAGARLVGPVSPSEHFSVAIRVRQTPEGKRQAAEFARIPPSRRPRLSDQTIDRVFGADPLDVKRVVAFTKGRGFAIIEASVRSRTVLIAGTAAKFSEFFETKLERYEYQGGIFRGRIGAIRIPREIADVVTGVFGLDNFPARPFTSGSNLYAVSDVASAYNFPMNFDGTGQTIAILALIPAGQFGGYFPADLEQFYPGLSQRVFDISVDGTPNLPSAMAPAAGTDLDLEITCDIELAGALAPGARILVYFATNSALGFCFAVETIVHDDINRPDILSISYGSPWPGPDNLIFDDQTVSAMEDSFLAASLKRMTVVAASGDFGSTGGPIALEQGTSWVSYPASSPNVTGCGGSVVTLANGAISYETAWNNPTALIGYADKTSGGGFSTRFTAPSWQQDAVGAYNNENMRGVPDVCGHADSYKVVLRGNDGFFWGTSAVAPLWAALMARINQRLGWRVGNVSAFLYEPSFAATCRDVLDGSNGYIAGAGWDPCTGLGSPIGTALSDQLALPVNIPAPVKVPTWQRIEDVDRGAPNATPPLSSADDLGLEINPQMVANNGQGDAGDIISITPAANTDVQIGSTVTVQFWGLGPND